MYTTESKSAPRCFIVGAGASRDAGYPLVDGFVDSLNGWVDNATAPEFNEDDHSILACYRDDLRPVIERTRVEMQESDRDNIERLLEKLKKSDSQTYLLFEKIIFWMFFHFAGHGEVYNAAYFKDFFSKTQPGDCVISFNYDLLLEWALRDSGIEYTYNWSDNQKVRILKPHGAINFITNLDEESEVRVKHADGNVSKHKARQVFTRLSEYFRGNIGRGVWDIFNNKLGISHFYWDQFNIKGKQSFLILPELNKKDALEQTDCQFLRLTWEHIPDVLAPLQEMWVIGYNFSEGDKKAIDTIGPYLKDEARRVYVIDPEPKSTFLQELCAQHHVKHFAMTFQKYITSGNST